MSEVFELATKNVTYRCALVVTEEPISVFGAAECFCSLCVFRLAIRPNEMAHCLQVNCRSSVCCRKCKRSEGFRKGLRHRGQGSFDLVSVG